MELILITFCRFNFYVIKVTIQTSNYVIFESLYPLKGITGDYFSEEENFFEDSSVPLIKKFVSNVIQAYDFFTRGIEPFTKYMDKNHESEDVKELKRHVEKFISLNYQYTEFEYLSQITLEKFAEMHVNYFLTQTYPFENVFVMDDDLKIVENCMNLVLEQQIKKVVLVNFHDDIYAGTEISKKINLTEGRFPEELLLQEMLICSYSAPRLDNDKNPFQYQYFFEERFSKFDENKKLGLFLVSNSSKELFLFNKCLTKFWMNRY